MIIAEYHALQLPTMSVLVLVLPLVFSVSENAGVVQEEVNCGIETISRNSSERIVGGHILKYGQFPWVAALHYKVNRTGDDAGIICGGFVVNQKFVVTAANCLYFKNIVLDNVWLGVQKISDTDTTDVDKVRKYQIAEKIPHEQYNSITSFADIALLKLKGVITYSNYILPLCLPKADTTILNGGNLTVVGWGPLKNGNPVTDYKVAVEVPVYPANDCRKLVGRPIRGDGMCAEGEDEKGSCWPDGGLPLMLSQPKGDKREWYAMGIISTSTGCGNEEVVVHTRVSSHYDWIKRNTAWW